MLERVLEQVEQHLFDEHVVHGHERQVPRQLDVERPARGLRLEPMQSRADELLERMPGSADLDGARFESRHRQQVSDETVQPARLVRGGLQQLAPLGSRQRVLLLEQRRRDPGDHGERGAQVMRHRRQERAA